jgi:glycosyltransferase involved in cell wall biosynthesis
MACDPSSAPTFTVFTATFNRARTLPRVHASLAQQTFRDFEWLIVDDGSTDGTRELVETWLAEKKFPIRYVHKPNGGKHTAWNAGVDEARGQLFLCIDSDDACTPDALQVFHDAWQSIDPRRREAFTGVCCLVMDPTGEVVGDRFPEDVFDSDSNAMRFKYHIGGEKWGFHRIDVAREFRFPEYEDLRYVPESIVWGRIASRYQERFINKVLRVYYKEAAVRSPTSVPSWRNPRSFALGAQVALEEQAPRWFVHNPMFFLKAAANFSRNSWQTGAGVVAQGRRLNGATAHGLWLAMLPVGWTAGSCIGETWPAGTRRRDEPSDLKPERAQAVTCAVAFTARQGDNHREAAVDDLGLALVELHNGHTHEAYHFMMCHRIGRDPTWIMGFGTVCVASPMRTPSPPQKTTTFMHSPARLDKVHGRSLMRSQLNARWTCQACQAARIESPCAR